MTRKQKLTLVRIIVAGAFLIALLILNPQGWTGLVAYLAVYLLIGYDVLWRAVKGIASGQVFDENFLMTVATIGALILGTYSESVEVMLFYQIGELFQSYAVGRSRRSISALMDIRPDSAHVERETGLETVDPDDVAVDEVIIVRPGERVPLDGVVIEGASTVNTAALTGESLPREVKMGDEILSGCVNENGLLKVRVTKPFDESTVSRILDLVENSSLKKAKAENFITRFARYYTPAVCLTAVVLAIVPPLVLGGGWTDWIRRALTFLVISCPCALVISIPLTFFGGIGGVSRKGVLVKGGNYLEALAQTGTVVFDKTGTLTEGAFAVRRVKPAPGFTEREIINRAALAEVYSSHPISQSLQTRADGPLNAERVTQVEELAGYGVTALVDGRPVAVGNERLMSLLKIKAPAPEEEGTVVYAAFDNRYAGMIVIADALKNGAKEALEELHRRGIKTVMLTGDSQGAAERVAGELKLTDFAAELLPQDKVSRLEALMDSPRRKGTLCFVGDGINDAPVLSRADVGIAMGGVGSDAAIEAADVVLMDDDLRKLSLAIRSSRKCLRIVKENVTFALLIKAVCLVLGALGVTGMQAAIFADVGVMVLAVLNAMRALRIE